MVKSLAVLVSCLLLIEFLCTVQVEAIKCYACEAPDCGPGDTGKEVTCDEEGMCLKVTKNSNKEYLKKTCVDKKNLDRKRHMCDEKKEEVSCCFCNSNFCQ